MLIFRYDKRNFSFVGIKGGFLYKTPLTASVFKDFSSSYHHLIFSPTAYSPNSEPFVYVDSMGMKIVTNVIDGIANADSIFALSVADDGWVQMLAFSESEAS